MRSKTWFVFKITFYALFCVLSLGVWGLGAQLITEADTASVLAGVTILAANLGVSLLVGLDMYHSLIKLIGYFLKEEEGDNQCGSGCCS